MSVVGFTIYSLSCLMKLTGPIAILKRRNYKMRLPSRVCVLVLDVNVLVVAEVHDI